jgi:tetratricopeptide (TPR) repeat protein
VLENRHLSGAMTFQWWKDYNFVQKDRTESQRLRNLGNQVYQKNKLHEALDSYNQSICLAPHPPPPNAFLMHPVESHDEETHEELALGYANRSAVLFQLKEYELCIRDITRAFDNSYPNNLMYKLFERKARCLKALKEYPRYALYTLKLNAREKTLGAGEKLEDFETYFRRKWFVCLFSRGPQGPRG